MPLTCAKCGLTNLDGVAHCRSCKSPLQQLLYSLPPGTTLQSGKYRLERVVGEGGFGITYSAQQGSEAVAIKEFFPRGSTRDAAKRPILPSGLSKPWFERTRNQFLDEVRLLLPLAHLNIVKVYDCFQENDTAYMVMEFVKGRTLSALVKARGPLPPQEALRYLLQIGVALDTLHRSRLVHRDVKSENVLIDERHRAVLIDFGSMQMAKGEATPTEFSVVSHGFSPPELYTFQSRYGPGVDIYALAAMAYNILTGQIPVPAPERLKGHPLESIRTFNKLVSVPLEQALFRGLSLDPLGRPSSALGLVRALAAGDKGFPLIPTAPRTQPHPPPQASSAPSVPTPVPTPPSIPTPVPPPLSVPTRTPISSARIQAPTMGAQPSSAVRPVPSAGARTIQLVETLEGHSTGVTALAFSPDGRLLVSSSQNRIRFWEIENARKLFTLSEQQVNVIIFSPDGKTLIIGDVFGGLRVWEMATGQTNLICPSLSKSVSDGQSLSADGRWWSITNSRQEVEVWEVATGRKTRTFEETRTGIWALALSPNGDQLAIVRKDGKVKLWQTQTGAILGIRNNYQHAIKNLAFDPQTLSLFCTDMQGGLLLWDWQQSQENYLNRQGSVASGIACHPQTRIMVVTFAVYPYWQFWTLPPQATAPTKTPVSLFPPSPVRAFAFHPTELLLATAHSNGQIRLWQI